MTILTEIAAQLPDNNSEQITPAILRQVLLDMVADYNAVAAADDALAINLVQSTPNDTGTPVVGPVNVNHIKVTAGTQTVTGGDDAFDQIANGTKGLQVDYLVTGGGGSHYAINGMVKVTATNSGALGMSGGVAVDAGAVITGNGWGGEHFVKIYPGSTLNQVAYGSMGTVAVARGATVKDRAGVTACTSGAGTVTGYNAAYNVIIDTFEAAPWDGATPWDDGLFINDAFGFPIAATGNIIRTGTGTVANFASALGLTITGRIFSFLNFVVTGAGALWSKSGVFGTNNVAPVSGVPLTVSKNAAATAASASPLNTTVADFVNADGSATRLAARSFGSAAAPSLVGYSAQGTAAAPTQTKNNNGLALLWGVGYSQADSAYQTSGGAGVIAVATEDFDSTHGGSALQVFATPSGQTVQGIAATFWIWLSGGSMAVGDTALTKPAAGIIKAGVGYQIGNTAPTAGHVLRSDGAKFVDAQLGAADISGLAASATTDTTTQANVAFTGLTAAAAAADTDTFPVNQGAGNLKQTFAAIKTWIKSWIADTDLNGAAWATFTPIITSSAGSFTTVSATGRYKQIGKTVVGQVNITITTAGTAAGRLLATLPVNGKASTEQVCGIGKEIAVTGKSGAAQITAADVTRIYATDSTGATLIASGNNVLFNFTYEAA